MTMRGLPTISGPAARVTRWGALALVALLAACGGGGGGGPAASTTTTTPVTSPATGAPVSTPTPSGANAVALVVDRGTDGTAIDTPFVTVTVCEPASATCQTIDHVMVDTGSYGLRIAASALAANLSLPAVLAPNSGPLAECAGFVSGYAWGSVRRADVKVGGETALDVPIQVVSDPAAAYATVPTACSNTGPDMGVGTGAKGILGVGFLKQDCGPACATSTAPAIYFSCPASGCASSTAPLASQVTNPATLFATDNNGVAITMPDVPLGGTAGATGSLVFGVGTESNNQIGSAQVFTATTSAGNFSTVYQGRTLEGFIDSGSNGIFFHDSTIPTCASGFYCPPSPVTLAATVTGANGTSRSIPFTVESVAALPAGTAVAHLGGDLGLSANFDWGLPFFFNRTVFIAFQGAATPFGTGPYWAF